MGALPPTPPAGPHGTPLWPTGRDCHRWYTLVSLGCDPRQSQQTTTDHSTPTGPPSPTHTHTYTHTHTHVQSMIVEYISHLSYEQ